MAGVERSAFRVSPLAVNVCTQCIPRAQIMPSVCYAGLCSRSALEEAVWRIHGYLGTPSVLGNILFDRNVHFGVTPLAVYFGVKRRGRLGICNENFLFGRESCSVPLEGLCPLGGDAWSMVKRARLAKRSNNPSLFLLPVPRPVLPSLFLHDGAQQEGFGHGHFGAEQEALPEPHGGR